ncbi:Ankyrin repeat protein [Legionella shakespearei DSM 23087]|uniref:Ankyrin repeat protein n=2 Tax=Legionella shakespearei TaxID=45075 RepID=A0A0W0YLH7_9GAMM|nr:Ankyrin repeat protein [Legionella shakespearei DSM 23087]
MDFVLHVFAEEHALKRNNTVQSRGQLTHKKDLGVYMKIFELAKTVNEKEFDPLLLTDSIPLDKIDALDEQHHTPLFHAISEGDLKKTKYLLKNNATLQTDKYTPFLLACFFGQLEIAQFLYQEGCLNERDIYQNTPLMNAAWNGHTEVVEWLLSLGAEINATNVHGDSALYIALRYKHPLTASLLLEQKNIDAYNENVLSYDPIVIALFHGYLDIAKGLYNDKVNLNKQYTENNTLLHICALNGDLTGTEWLLNRGANPHISNSQALTPLMMAAQYGHPTIVSKYLADKNYQKQAKRPYELELALVMAAAKGQGAVLDILISHIKDIPETSIHAALLGAVMNDRCDVIPKLLTINPSKAASYVKKHYHFGDYPYNQGHTLLHAAADKGYLALAQNLAHLGAKLDAKNDNKDTVLHYAVRSGNLDLVRWLCNQNLDVNLKNKQGNTPLHFAVEIKNPAIIRCLLLHGADHLIENKLQDTPEFLARTDKELHSCFEEFEKRDLKHFGLCEIHQAVTSKEDKALLQILPVVHDLKQRSDDGLTAIQVAAHMNNLNPLVILLLWEAKGDRKYAQDLAKFYMEKYDSHMTAYKSFAQSERAIRQFPEHRLNILLKLYQACETKQNQQGIPATEPVVEQCASVSASASGRKLRFFDSSESLASSESKEEELSENPVKTVA